MLAEALMRCFQQAFEAPDDGIPRQFQGAAACGGADGIQQERRGIQKFPNFFDEGLALAIGNGPAILAVDDVLASRRVIKTQRWQAARRQIRGEGQ